ncbi:hypothetical protein BSZ14_06310 [Sphingomonas sp. Sph1(2015)]|nr:hypothetical protein BSZ14_06310 [Sphingomonas sp. Sph1(2015)]
MQRRRRCCAPGRGQRRLDRNAGPCALARKDDGPARYSARRGCGERPCDDHRLSAGGAGLASDAKATLDRLAADPAVRSGNLILRGHSDSEGDDEANRIMSRKRAEAVRDYLVRKGLDRSRMRVIALGETRPVAPNAKPDGSDDSEGRARNRRVEIELEHGG